LRRGGTGNAKSKSRPTQPPTARRTKQRAAHGALRYILDKQVGFILRQVVQRHIAIFTKYMVAELTPTQFAALAKLYQVGPCSQNRLGRLTAMDAATIKGVIDRLTKRSFTELRADANDARLLMVHLTSRGRRIAEAANREGTKITAETLAPLSKTEQAVLLKMLKRLC
jgi:MarR family transcriptional regulator, lower aerobic nicotinate degradation pathway regulator